jgi:hypothetical protein
MRSVPLVAIAALVSVVGAHGPASPVTLTKAEAAAVAKQIEKDRAGAEAWLRSSPTSYLAAVSRTDFESRTTLSVGGAPDNDVSIDSDDVLPHRRVDPEPGGRIDRLDAEPVSFDGDTQPPASG